MSVKAEVQYTHVKPTKYAGILFRSRLEARWAVFFDAMGITWEYEPETLIVDHYDDLASAFEYTPDFRLPGVHPVGKHIRLNEEWEGAHPESVDRYDEMRAANYPLYVEVKPTEAHVKDRAGVFYDACEFKGPCAGGLVFLGAIPHVGALSWLPVHPFLMWAKGTCGDWGWFQSNENGRGEFASAGGHRYVEEDLSKIDGSPLLLAGYGLRGVAPTKLVVNAYNAARNERFGLGGSR